MPSELANDDEIAYCKENRFRIKVFHITFDKLDESTQIDSGNNKNLYLPCFNRRWLHELKKLYQQTSPVANGTESEGN